MAKRHKKKNRQQAAPPVDAADVGARLSAALTEKRDHSAWSLARQLLAVAEDRDACAGPCCAALELRARRLVAKGECRDAVSMVETYLEANPDFAARLPDSFRVFMELKGGKPELLAGYGSDRETDAWLDELLAVEIRDPRDLFTASGLAADHPLALQARLVWNAWEAVEEDSPAAESALSELVAIPRHSPLAGWRLFVQALAAFYANDDERCQANVQRIPETSGAQTCARIVADLLAGRQSTAPGGATVVDAVYRDTLANQALAVLSEDSENNPNFVERAGTVIRRTFAQGRPGLTLDLLVLAVRTFPMESRSRRALERCLPPKRRGQDRWLELLLVREEHYDGWPLDGETIDYALAEGKWSPIEVAVARRRQALLFAEAARHGEFGADKNVQQHFRQSVQALPLRATFTAWLELVQQCGLDARELARLWVKAFPDDERPLLVMLDDARRRHDPRGMAAMYDALEKLARGHEAFEIRRGFVAAELAVALTGGGREAAAGEWLDRVPTDGVWNAIARLSAAYLASTRKGKRAIGLELGQLGVPLAVWLAFECLRGENLQTTALPASVRVGLEHPEQLCASLRLMAELPDPIWRRIAHSQFFREAPCRRLEEAAFSDLQVVDLLGALFDLCPGGVDGLSFLAFYLTRKGLSRKPVKATPFAGNMLVFRIWAVAMWMKAHDCLRVSETAADEMAEILRAAETMLGDDPEAATRIGRLAAVAAIGDYRQRCKPLTKRAALKILRREGARTSPFDYVDAWHGYTPFGTPFGGAPPRGGRPQPRSLFEALEDMLKSVEDPAEMEDLLRRMAEEMDDELDESCRTEPSWDDEDGGEAERPPPRRRAGRCAENDPRQPTFGFLDEIDE